MVNTKELQISGNATKCLATIIACGVALAAADKVNAYGYGKRTITTDPQLLEISGTAACLATNTSKHHTVTIDIRLFNGDGTALYSVDPQTVILGPMESTQIVVDNEPDDSLLELYTNPGSIEEDVGHTETVYCQYEIEGHHAKKIRTNLIINNPHPEIYNGP